MKESIGNQRVRRSDALRLAVIDRGRRSAILRRIEFSLFLDGFLHALVFVHAKSLDPGHTKCSLVRSEARELSVATGPRSFLSCGAGCGLSRSSFLKLHWGERDADVFVNRLPFVVIFRVCLAVGPSNRLCRFVGLKAKVARLMLV